MLSQVIQFHLASKLLCESSLEKYSQACICLNNITPEHILRQIYLIETYQSLIKIPLDEKTQQWYDCLNQLFEHCGWFIPFEDVCIVCDRPNKFSLDSESRLHAEGEPAIQLDSFREYNLIKIDANADVEPIVLLKMICPSTGYTHVLRVPPNMESAREAITWVNWGIDPEDFAVES